MKRKTFLFYHAYKGICLLSYLLLAACHQVPHSNPLVFHDVITLENDSIRIGISPATGRIVDFGFIDSTNLLWLNTPEVYQHPTARPNHVPYYNLGGDRLDPMLQLLWPRAFGMKGGSASDGVIAGEPWRILEHSPHHVVIQSGLSQNLGIYARRSITLDPHTAEVTIHNTLTRVKQNPFPVQIWTITQIPTPDTLTLDIAADRPEGIAPWMALSDPEKLNGQVHQPDSQKVAVRPSASAEGKIGTYGREIQARWNTIIFTQQTNYIPTAAYPDASCIQTYWSIAAGYAELELLSPFVHLQPGESLSNQVLWKLTRYSDSHQ